MGNFKNTIAPSSNDFNSNVLAIKHSRRLPIALPIESLPSTPNFGAKSNIRHLKHSSDIKTIANGKSEHNKSEKNKFQHENSGKKSVYIGNGGAKDSFHSNNQRNVEHTPISDYNNFQTEEVPTLILPKPILPPPLPSISSTLSVQRDLGVYSSNQNNAKHTPISDENDSQPENLPKPRLPKLILPPSIPSISPTFSVQRDLGAHSNNQNNAEHTPISDENDFQPETLPKLRVPKPILPPSLPSISSTFSVQRDLGVTDLSFISIKPRPHTCNLCCHHTHEKKSNEKDHEKKHEKKPKKKKKKKKHEKKIDGKKHEKKIDEKNFQPETLPKLRVPKPILPPSLPSISSTFSVQRDLGVTDLSSISIKPRPHTCNLCCHHTHE